MSRIRQIIKEELEVILTNQEVGDLFGKAVQAKLEEAWPAGAERDEAAEEEGEAESAAALAGGDKANYAASAAPPTLEEIAESDLTDTMASCLERILNPEGEDDVFATLDAHTVGQLETLYDIIISGRVQLEGEDHEEEKGMRIAKQARAAAEARKRLHQRQARARRPRSPGDFRSQKDRMDNP